MNISYKNHVTNEDFSRNIQAAIGEYGELLTMCNKRKRRWFGAISKSSGSAKTILQSAVTEIKGVHRKRVANVILNGGQGQLRLLRTGPKGNEMCRVSYGGLTTLQCYQID